MSKHLDNRALSLLIQRGLMYMLMRHMTNEVVDRKLTGIIKASMSARKLAGGSVPAGVGYQLYSTGWAGALGTQIYPPVLYLHTGG